MKSPAGEVGTTAVDFWRCRGDEVRPCAHFALLPSSCFLFSAVPGNELTAVETRSQTVLFVGDGQSLSRFANCFALTPSNLQELCDILARGLIRLRVERQKSSEVSRDHGESPLDFSPDQSGHANPSCKRNA